MSILSDLIRTIEPIPIPVETGYFSGRPPDEYLVITPLSDRLEFYADNTAHLELEEARISLFSKYNYLKLKNQLTKVLLKAGFTITDRRYVGFEDDTKYHHYSVDVLKEYEMEES